MKLKEFYYELPKELIAQEPLSFRDHSRLLILDRQNKKKEEGLFKDIIDIVTPLDCIVFNNTKVIPARVFGKKESGAKIELLFVKGINNGLWEVLIKPAKRVRINTKILVGEDKLEIVNKSSKGTWIVKCDSQSIKKMIELYGVMPTPPYIKKKLNDPSRYQTVFAKEEGSIAAPTAGLHFTPSLIEKISSKGTRSAYVTLHVGLGTFRPINTEDIKDYVMDKEHYFISEESAQIINETKNRGGRVFAVGTTVTRLLESVALKDSSLVNYGEGETGLFIYPAYNFKIVDCLLTNFHLPCSTNFILVCAFAGLEFVKEAYHYAIERKFRFYSFGDAMLII
ncbi:MAG: tRNA preQ1(34) S-adenosylmethionine ribosyltransferase-isomerase QueA [Candidatus Omnitrophica bacterium]|nr:tRNA preQ1(34) S-adenosylmethionine ribosyltransferase-isomerase QueA [Candidatus Omnitrophota bacterium]